MTPLRVLCLDIEGGHGGSSRSLYYALKHIDRGSITPTVWCRRDGPIRRMYAALDIPVEVRPDLPKASALPKVTRNLWQLALYLQDFVRSQRRGTLRALEATVSTHDLVHFNHEGFAGLALWLRRQTARPATLHIRTNVHPTPFARLQMKAISAAVDHVVFITPNEERTFRSLGAKTPGTVIYNIAEPTPGATPHPSIPQDGRLVIASLSNASYLRGTDRLLDLAEALKRRGRDDVLIVSAGDMQLKGSEWPGDLGAIASIGGTLEDAAAARGLAGRILFLGHVSDPESVLAGSDLLIKPTRESNPWGRDILEALAAGKPVLSVGSDQTFVETGVTGILQPRFDADDLAADIANLANDRPLVFALGAAARARIAELCGGKARARDLAQVWLSAAGRAPTRQLSRA
jgi:glycosyltransferase involved in cell wall biosynthesis